AGGFPRRLSTLPPLTRPPPAGVVDSWRPLPPIRRAQTRPVRRCRRSAAKARGLGTPACSHPGATGAACNPLATAAACDPLATAAACDPLATAAACDPLATAAAPQPPVVDGSSTVAPLPWRPPPVNPGLGSGDEERPPPRPGCSSRLCPPPALPLHPHPAHSCPAASLRATASQPGLRRRLGRFRPAGRGRLSSTSAAARPPATVNCRPQWRRLSHRHRQPSPGGRPGRRYSRSRPGSRPPAGRRSRPASRPPAAHPLAAGHPRPAARR
ncbi:hypothetical protein BOX15_Mlig000485g1, partial [Macrostomum lignano]